MVSNWSYWCLFAAWAIAFGLSIFWNAKYRKLKQAYKNLKYLNELKENYSVIGASRRRRYNEDGSYVGYKTAWLADMAIERQNKIQSHCSMVDAKLTFQLAFQEMRTEIPLLITNFSLKINESENEK